MDDEENARLVVMYRSGHPVKKIALSLGVDSRYVSKRLRASGINLKSGPRPSAASRNVVEGSVHGRLTVQRVFSGTDRSGRGRMMCECRCACGNLVILPVWAVARKNNTSCGCRPKSGQDGPGWSGCGLISGYCWAQIRESAKWRKDQAKREFTITIEEVWLKYQEQGGKCALSGLPIVFAATAAEKRKRKQTASLDRIDSSKGYVPGNVQWLHRDVNRMKSDFPEDRFLELCGLIAANMDQAIGSAMKIADQLISEAVRG